MRGIFDENFENKKMSHKVKIGDYVKIRTGKLDANAAVENGKYPFFTCAIEPLAIDTFSYECECVLVAGNGDLNVKYYNGKFEAYQRTYIIESLDKNKLSVPYLYRFFETYIETLREQSIGGVIKYIKLENLTGARLYVPLLNEQREIVEKISVVDRVLKDRKYQLELLNELVKVRFVEMFGDPVINSFHLPEATLPELGELGRGVSKHRPRNAPELLNGLHPLIQTGEVAAADIYITSYENTYSELGLQQSKMWNEGTLCITIAANIAKTAILGFDACFPDSVVGFNANEKANNIFIHYWFSFFQAILEAQAPESAQKNINLKILSELKIIVPPIKLQNQFAAFVKQTDKSKSAVKKSIKKLEILKKSLMQQYFGRSAGT